MSVDKYSKFITEQVKSQVRGGYRSIKLNEQSLNEGHSFDDEHHYDKAMDTQYKMISAKYGKNAADEANYGWGEGKHSITTKIYAKKRGQRGHTLLHTTIDPKTGEHDHEFRGDDQSYLKLENN